MNKKKIWIIASAAAIVIIALIVVLAVIFGKGGKSDPAVSSSGSANIAEKKIDAKSVIDALKTDGQEIVVESFPQRVVNVVIDSSEERLEVKENPETGRLNGIELMVSYDEKSREAAVETLFKDAKRIIKACIPDISDERAEAIIIRFRQSIPEIGKATTCTETEGEYAFAVSYFPDKAYFIVS